MSKLLKSGQTIIDVATVAEHALKNFKAIDYEQTLKVWGVELVHPKKNLEVYTPTSKEPAFRDPNFHFKEVVLHGFSVADMAKKFPNHNWGGHRRNNQKGVPGKYLISYENPLANLPPALQKEQHPKECYRLDFNLLIELLLDVLVLGQENGGNYPSLFYSTTFTNDHGEEICAGIAQGKITFMTSEKAHSQNKAGVCLVKAEKWM